MSNKIIPGYKGIMDLDLTNIHPIIHESLIKQHKKDIEDYKIYQESLDPKQRYENTIERIEKSRKHHQYLANKWRKKEEEKYKINNI